MGRTLRSLQMEGRVERFRERGERCMIYDKMSSYTRSFFDRARDVLLNPLDARSPR